ncbi:tyrosine-type recombinase/integrase [uncultured Anaerobiospirillum sp.]|uniref:tyrosine-type recombinase/integrase n=1 Tax=uncultured Anaerobiospirillum sp. TaxID=265728 RepID=UPI0028045E48|nr:integrase arm-type DNA-binding domain-containing protein [uncultured Anaerobiospirillum sp.]
MAKNKLTNLEVANLLPKEKHYLVGDGGGLNIKVYPNGRKQWLLRKSSQGKAQNIVLGDYPAMSLSSARAKVKEVSSNFVDGRKQREDNPVLFGELTQQWLATKNIKASSMAATLNSIKPLDVFHNKPLKDITALDARKAVAHYIEQGQFTAARNTLQCLAQIERHGLALGLTDTARLQYVSRTLPSTPVQHRRFVEPDRLPEVFELMKKKLKINVVMPDIVKVLCLTLCRINEVVALRYDWIDFDQKVITIPASQMKSKREHRIPICTQLEKILKRRQALGGVFVFPNPSSKSGHKSKLAHARLIPFNELTTLHGFRSTGRSWMARNGYDFAASEYCLAHRCENTTQASYQRYDYLEQRRTIMQAWGDFVERCYSPYYPE